MVRQYAFLVPWLLGGLGVSCGGQTSGGSGPTTGDGGPSTTGAGGGSDAVSCTIVQSFSAGGTSLTLTFCTEASGLTPDQVNAQKTTCSSTITLDGGLTQTSSFSQGLCPRANVLGGCRNTSGGYTVTIWYYMSSALTVDQLQAICAGVGGTYEPAP